MKEEIKKLVDKVKKENIKIKAVDPQLDKIKIEIEGKDKLIVMSYAELDEALEKGWLREL